MVFMVLSSRRSSCLPLRLFPCGLSRSGTVSPLPPQACPDPQAPLVANRLGLTLYVGEEGRLVISLQPHFDEGPEDDLEAHRELERGRRLPRQDASPVQDVLRENEKDFRFIREHHHLHLPS